MPPLFGRTITTLAVLPIKNLTLRRCSMCRTSPPSGDLSGTTLEVHSVALLHPHELEIRRGPRKVKVSKVSKDYKDY